MRSPRVMTLSDLQRRDLKEQESQRRTTMGAVSGFQMDYGN